MGDPLDHSHTAPKFAAPDPRELADWYVTHLLFPHCTVHEDGHYAIVRRGNLTLHFWRCANRNIAENTACYTQIDTVEKLNQLHAEFKQASSQTGFAPGSVQDIPLNTDYGMREFHVWDPAGNLIGFGAGLASV